MESIDEGRNHSVTSHIFYCYNCGEVFAKVVNGGTYFAYRSCCTSCPPEGEYFNWLPGSIWTGNDEFNNALPKPLIEREFWLHLAALEKENEDEAKNNSDLCI